MRNELAQTLHEAAVQLMVLNHEPSAYLWTLPKRVLADVKADQAFADALAAPWPT
jgi:hypothetical protein